MLQSLKNLENYGVDTVDGTLGTVVNFLFDDERWTVRHLVVEPGGLSGRRVLISPISFRGTDGSTRRFQLALTSEKVMHSPSIDTDRPVSRQVEDDYYRYYDSPLYWAYPGIWGMGAYPGPLAAARWAPPPTNVAAPRAEDVHLRSFREVCGYHIRGTDDGIGHVDDFIVDDETWEVRYLVIDTSNWWFGKKVLVSPHWASHVSWTGRTVDVALARQVIKDSPEWDPSAGVNREYEVHLYDYYGRPTYWNSNPRAAEPPPKSRSGAHPI